MASVALPLLLLVEALGEVCISWPMNIELNAPSSWSFPAQPVNAATTRMRSERMGAPYASEECERHALREPTPRDGRGSVLLHCARRVRDRPSTTGQPPSDSGAGP